MNCPTAFLTSSSVLKIRPWMACSLSVRLNRSATSLVSGSSTNPKLGVINRHFPIIMIDGIHMGDHLVLIALGIDFEGKKQVLGLRVGDTENGRVVRSLLRDLLDRGLEQERARLFVFDGAKALTSAIQKTFGSLAEIRRCQIHRRRNILGHLSDRLHESVKAILREAWSLGDAKWPSVGSNVWLLLSKSIIPGRRRPSKRVSTIYSRFSG
jgi:hypothetical protein